MEMIKLGIDLLSGSKRLVKMTTNGKVMRNHIKLIQFSMLKDIRRPTHVGKLMGQVNMYSDDKLTRHDTPPSSLINSTTSPNVKIVEG